MIIAGRFNGPPGSGNGGYSAGLVATLLPGPAATVTLRRPPPLDVPLDVRRAGDGVAVYDRERLIAEGAPAEAPTELVPAVPPGDAEAAMERYPGFAEHPFPTCYVCGPRRAVGDGLRIFPGPVGDGRTAAVWRVPDDVASPTLWAALDCPGGWAINSPGRPYVLGSVTAAVVALPSAGEECVVLGQAAGIEGRKAWVRSTVYGPDGSLVALAAATWIAIESS